MKTTIKLNGTWKFTPTYDQKVTNNHNVIEANVPLYSHKDLVRTAWDDVKVPGVWQTYAEKYSVFEGVCWFFREFEVDSLSENTFAELVCKGINYKAEIYINGTLATVHESAYTEFSVDISKYLQKGTNCIAIEVDNRPHIVKWPNDWGYGVFGGIHRDIFINLFDGEYVRDIELTPDYDVNSKRGTLSFKAKGTAKSVSLKLEDSISEVISNDGEFVFETEYDIIPWSPETPKLYELSVLIDGNVCETYKIGFRNISKRKRQLYLNGEKLELKGACYLADSPANGLAMTREEIKNDLLSMKAANVTSVRTHYPMCDDFYELCDELGLTSWIEPNIYCSKPAETVTNTVFKRPDFIEVAVSMTKEMIKGARRFASVILYGIGNECNVNHPEAVPFFETIAKTVKDEDSTRLVGYASLYGIVGKITHLVDVMGINSYCGWYGTIGTFDITDERNGEMRIADVSAVHGIIENVEKETNDDTVLLLTEFGGDSVPGFISPECALWSENYHAQVVEKYIEAAREHNSVCGYYVFAFTDYHDPSKPLNGMWNGFNLKGMISFDRKIKLPYYALKKSYEKNK